MHTHTQSTKSSFIPKNIVDSPLCKCGSIKNNYNFLFNCPNYIEICVELARALLKTLLFGDEDMSNETHTVIFETVQYNNIS